MPGKIDSPSNFVPLNGIAFGAEGDDAQPVSVTNPLPVGARATTYAVVSIASLSAGQAAGTATILVANAARKSLMVNPPADCVLTITSGATTGWPLFAGVPNTITGQECPAQALYVSGLAVAANLVIWEG